MIQNFFKYNIDFGSTGKSIIRDDNPAYGDAQFAIDIPLDNKIVLLFDIRKIVIKKFLFRILNELYMLRKLDKSQGVLI